MGTLFFVYLPLSFLIFFLFAPAPAFSIKVSVEGVEPIQNRPIGEVRDVALSDALRAAVEKAAKEVSVSLEDKYIRMLKNEDHLGYIKAYRILQEFSTGKEYKISVEADVDSEKLKGRLRDYIGVGVKSFQKPSISVVVLMNPDSDPVVDPLSLRDIRREIAVIFIGSGYVIVEPPGGVTLETYAGVRSTQRQLKENRYYVFGNVYIRAKDQKGILIAEANESSYLTGGDLGGTRKKALLQAASRAASKLKSEFDTRWNRRDNGVEISFSGIKSYKQYEQLDETLSNSVLAIDGITRRVFEDGNVTFSVLPRVTPEELAGILGNISAPTFSLRLDKVYSNRIEFSIITR